MKKLIALMAFAFAGSLAASASAQDVITGTYVNDAGTVVITDPANKAPNNFDVSIQDKSGKCSVKIVATTNKVTATGKNGAVYNIKVIASVEKTDYPNFSLWPEDETINLAPDALPFDKLDPACQAFKNNMTFTRQK